MQEIQMRRFEILDHDALFTEWPRILVEKELEDLGLWCENHKLLYVYDLRHGDDDSVPLTVENMVLINRYGTVITDEPIEGLKDENAYVLLGEADWGFTSDSDEVTMSEFYKERSGAEQKRVRDDTQLLRKQCSERRLPRRVIVTPETVESALQMLDDQLESEEQHMSRCGYAWDYAWPNTYYDGMRAMLEQLLTNDYHSDYIECVITSDKQHKIVYWDKIWNEEA